MTVKLGLSMVWLLTAVFVFKDAGWKQTAIIISAIWAAA